MVSATCWRKQAPPHSRSLIVIDDHGAVAAPESRSRAVLDSRWLRRVAVLAAGLVALVLASGLYLTFRYRPSSARFGGGGYSRGVWVDAAVTVHRVAAYLLLGAVAALAVLLFAAVPSARPVRRAVAMAGAATMLPLTVAAALVTGIRLPWDQLALDAVTVGGGRDPIRGVLGLPDSVKYVLIGAREISPSTYARTAWIHVLVIPVVLVATAALAWMVARTRLGRSPRPRDDSAPAANVLG